MIPSTNQVQIRNGEDKSFFVNLVYTDTGEPFDLTGASEIVAAFPGASGTPVEEKLSASRVTVVGAPGAGKISINCPAADTALMKSLQTPLLQDLQINVTIASKLSVFVLPSVLNISPQPYVVT